MMVNDLISLCVKAGHCIGNGCSGTVVGKGGASDVDRYDSIAAEDKVSQMVIQGVEPGNYPGQGRVAMDMTRRPVDGSFGHVAGIGVDGCRIPVVIPLFLANYPKKRKNFSNGSVEGDGCASLDPFCVRRAVLAMAGGDKGCQHDNKYVFHGTKNRIA